MEQLVRKTWQTLLVQGLISVVVGLILLFWTQISLFLLIVFFGAYALIDGISGAFGAFVHRKEHPDWWVWLVLSIFSILFGLAILFWPRLTGLVLLYLIAARAVVMGGMELVSAFRMRRGTNLWWLMLATGAFSVLFGLVIFFWPGATALALVWLIGLYLVMVGFLLIGLAFLARSYRDEIEQAYSASS